ncbi:hypothetical protein [Candidatus Vidania fulgoroideorum]
MHSFKNDFLITEKNVSKSISLLSDRKSSVGFDQIFMVNLNKLKFNIFNKDGTECETCINGIRCLSFYLKKKMGKNAFLIKTKKTKYKVKILKKTVCLKNIEPIFFFKKIGFLFSNRKMFIKIDNNTILINFFLKKLYFSILSLGNPHVIFFKKINFYKIVKFLKKNFIYGVNITSYFRKKITTFERGAGFTKSCGSANTSLGVFMILKSKKKFTYLIKDEFICISWLGKNIFCKKKIKVIGTCKFLYKGNYDI